MAIEFFEDSGRGFLPKASIRRQGQIGFNHGAVLRFKLDDWRYAKLGYDRETKEVIVRLVPDAEKDNAGVKSLAVQGTGGASLGAKSFFDYFGIDYKETRSFDVAQQDGTNDLVFKV